MTNAEIDLKADVIDMRDLIARVEELESEGESQEGAELRETLVELATLQAILDDLKGYGGDEQWRGDWYPVTLIAESYFTDYARDLVLDCYDLKGLPHFVHIDWELTAREVKVDYSEIEIDGVTYFYR